MSNVNAAHSPTEYCSYILFFVFIVSNRIICDFPLFMEAKEEKKKEQGKTNSAQIVNIREEAQSHFQGFFICSIM